jgi:ribosome-associated protein
VIVPRSPASRFRPRARGSVAYPHRAMSISDGDVFIRPGFVISAAELSWRYAASGGPGGQHANTANTRVELSWSIVDSAAVSETIRELLTAKLGEELRIVVSEERSQLRNRNLAVERLTHRVRAALIIPRRRVATKPSAGARARLRENKTAQSERKTQRRRVDHRDGD